MQTGPTLTLTFLAAVVATSAIGQTKIDGDVFASPPPVAKVAGKPACQPAKTYVDLLNAQRWSEIAPLFAPDAVFLTPLNSVLRGRAEIDDLYRKSVPKHDFAIVPVSFTAEGSECFMELAFKSAELGSDKYTLFDVYHFSLDPDGKIAQLIVYLRPNAAKAAEAAAKK